MPDFKKLIHDLHIHSFNAGVSAGRNAQGTRQKSDMDKVQQAERALSDAIKSLLLDEGRSFSSVNPPDPQKPSTP